MNTLLKVLLAGLCILFISSCSETDDSLDNNIDTIYENRSNENKSDISLLEDNLITVERIGRDHRIAGEILDELKVHNIPPDNCNLDNIQRFRFNYSDCNIYSIENSGSEEKTILYEYGGMYLVAQARLEFISDTVRLFELHTPDGNLCYSMEISVSNRIGEVVVNENPMLNAFRESVSDQIQKKSLLKGTKADYCRQEATWSDCFACSLNYCSTKWYCVIGVAIYPAEFLTGFAASCIGAGPDATP